MSYDELLVQIARPPLERLNEVLVKHRRREIIEGVVRRHAGELFSPDAINSLVYELCECEFLAPTDIHPEPSFW